MHPRAQNILDYWFSGIDEGTILNAKVPSVDRWFKKSEQTDQHIRMNFEKDLNWAKQGGYDAWAANVRERLALTILLDQFSRNIYRNTPVAFAADEKALLLALRSDLECVERNFKVHECVFLFMPLMHSEDLEVQRKSVAAFGRLLDCANLRRDRNAEYCRSTMNYAERHFDIIQQFGRFPHRNRILRRISTLPEEEFLKKPGSGF